MLGDLPVNHDDRVLIDYRTSDDAGVYRLDGTRALVQTVDFFTPIVDDGREEIHGLHERAPRIHPVHTRIVRSPVVDEDPVVRRDG